ncbi:hypothetical protein FOL47_010953 [Perkinsus chesapeaki]|uniref:Cytochrome c oxidase subunit 5B, mitochondrial n=1 Tax=Perkinsus chesapeaki TaxID=330153 RepID=A0A7J6N1H5_PERCH|nr:hypothetical protein FOL47_010953 [Perkinsus chesapeaki]
MSLLTRTFNRFIGSPSVASRVAPALNKQQSRWYRHWHRMSEDDWALPLDSMPEDVKTLMSTPQTDRGFVEDYWYNRIRGEATLLDPEALPSKSYIDLARDMGLQIVDEPSSHMMGLIELYEYLRGASFVGPFGTIENPVLVPAVGQERVVACTGGIGDEEHFTLWFRCREGFMYRCGECDQIFMLVRLYYEDRYWTQTLVRDTFMSDGDMFDLKTLERVHKMWNKDEMVRWEVGYWAQDYVLGKGVLPGMVEEHTRVN